MINKLIFSLILGVSFLPMSAQTGHEEAIAKTLNYYLDGGTNNEFETLSKAFHVNATMKYISGEGYKEVNAREFFKSIMRPGPAQNRKTSIESIEISGHAAQARLKIEYETFYFHDFMQLLKIDGQWKVTSKIFYKESK